MTFKEKWNDAWDGFQAGKWNKEVNLRDFIQLNYTPYDGDDSFLAGPTQNTKDLWAQVTITFVLDLLEEFIKDCLPEFFSLLLRIFGDSQFIFL